MGDEPKVIVLLARLVLSLVWSHPQPPHSLVLEEGYHLGRKMLLEGQNGASEKSP